MANAVPRPARRLASREPLVLAPLAALASLTLLASLPTRAAAAGIERQFDAAPGGRLEVDSQGASIAVTTHEASTARVSITRGGDDEEDLLDDYRVDITQTGDLLRVELERKKPWRLFHFRFEGTEIEIELPRRFDVDAVTSGGAVAIEDLDGEVDARTSGGSVRAYLSQPPGADSQLRTSGGGITVFLDEGIGVDLDARANRVTSQFTVAGESGTDEDGELVGAINGGGPALVLRSSGGGIRVLRR